MKASLALFATIAARATAFTPSAHVGRRSMSANSVPLANGAMSFDRVCREWRCKYEGDKATSESLEAISKVVDEFLPQIKAISSGVTVNRLVCGGCLDFKLMTTVSLIDDLSFVSPNKLHDRPSHRPHYSSFHLSGSIGGLWSLGKIRLCSRGSIFGEVKGD